MTLAGLALAIGCGCGANLIDAGRNKDAGVDAPAPPPDAAPPIDAEVDAAPIDARACIDGDARMPAPDGSCLILINAPQSFDSATVTCQGLGAHLAILSTMALDTAGEQLVGTRDTFIGLTDRTTEGQFLWVNGTVLTFSNWEAGEPNNGGGGTLENCAIIAGTRPQKGWDDRPCAPVGGNTSSGLYSVLCQR